MEGLPEAMAITGPRPSQDHGHPRTMSITGPRPSQDHGHPRTTAVPGPRPSQDHVHYMGHGHPRIIAVPGTWLSQDHGHPRTMAITRPRPLHGPWPSQDHGCPRTTTVPGPRLSQDVSQGLCPTPHFLAPPSSVRARCLNYMSERVPGLFRTLKERLAVIKITCVLHHEAGLRCDGVPGSTSYSLVQTLAPLRPAGEPPSPSEPPCLHLWHGEHSRVNPLDVLRISYQR